MGVSTLLAKLLARGIRLGEGVAPLLKTVDEAALDKAIAGVLERGGRELTVEDLAARKRPLGGVTAESLYSASELDATAAGFASYYADRLKAAMRIFSERGLRPGEEDGKTVLVGLVSNKFTSKKGNIVMEVEDWDGTRKVLVYGRSAAGSTSRGVLMDDAVAVRGRLAEQIGMVVADELVQLDTPRPAPRPAADGEIMLIGDLHIGSSEHIESAWDSFRESVMDKKDRIRAIIIGGDLVDGIGVFPQQYRHLVLKTLEEQERAAARCLKGLPQNIPIVYSCLTADTRVFVKGKGLVSFNDIRVNDVVLSVKEAGNGTLNTVWSPVEKVHILKYSGAVLGTASRTLKMRVTPDHAVLLLPWRGSSSPKQGPLKYVPAERAFRQSWMSVPSAGEIVRPAAPITDDQLRLLAWFVAEGTWLTGKRGIQIYQNEGPMFIRIKNLLERVGFKYSVYTGHHKKHKVIYIPRKHRGLFEAWVGRNKEIDLLADTLSAAQIRTFLQEYSLGDGYAAGPHSFVISTCLRSNAERMAIMAIMGGWSTKITKRTRDTSFKRGATEYVVNISKKWQRWIPKMYFYTQPYEGAVFDITTKYGNFLAERDGTFFFTGNCGNHDVFDFIPSPPVPAEFAAELYAMPNVVMAGNPCSVNVAGTRVLVYHGQALVTMLSLMGLAYDSAGAAQAMQALLRRRTLAGYHGDPRCRLVPTKADGLLIREPPHLFVTGHLHISAVGSYNGVALANPGTMQAQTPYMIEKGIEVTPPSYIAVDLSTMRLETRLLELDMPRRATERLKYPKGGMCMVV